MYVCVCVFMYVFMYVCIYIYTYIYILCMFRQGCIEIMGHALFSSESFNTSSRMGWHMPFARVSLLGLSHRGLALQNTMLQLFVTILRVDFGVDKAEG